MANIGLGFELMIVGMLTVFAILLIVIYGGKLLIVVCNKIFPAEAAVHHRSADEDFSSVRLVLEAAVNKITAGKGHITSIKKL